MARKKSPKKNTRKKAPMKKAARKAKNALRKASPKARKAVRRAVTRNKAAPKKGPLKKATSKAKPKGLAKKKELKIEKPKEPTAEQRAEMKRITGILGDAYIRQVLIEVGGENALAIVRNFFGYHSDEELAKKLKIKISDVRATLNKLHNEGLVNYVRQKDSETGWYSYSWSLNHTRMEKWATDQASKITGFGDDSGENYYCPACGASTISCFEDAVAGDFRCCHCNRMLEFLDNGKMAEIFERRRLP